MKTATLNAVTKTTTPAVIDPLELLSAQDRARALEAFTKGPGALVDAGLTVQQIQEFLSRPGVQAYTKILEAEFQHQEALDLRQRFAVRRRLARSADQAVDILEQALEGNVPEKDANGNPLMDASGHVRWKHREPSEMQYDAASQLLDRLGCRPIGSKDLTGMGSDANVGVLLTKAAEEATIRLVEDTAKASPAERSLSRERVRIVMEKLAAKVAVGHDKIEQLLGKSQRAIRKAKKAAKDVTDSHDGT